MTKSSKSRIERRFGRGILSLAQPVAPPKLNGYGVPPTMTPTEAALFDLARIMRKAAQGLDGPGRAFPRGWSCPPASPWLWGK